MHSTPQGEERAREVRGKGSAHLQVDIMPKGNSTPQDSRGAAALLEPDFPASGASLALPGELAMD